MFAKIDYAIAILIGFFVGIFAIPTLINLDVHTNVAMRFGISAGLFLSLIPWIMAVVYLIAVWIGDQLSKKLPIFVQFTKFGAVGVLNTLMDFGVFNLMLLLAPAGIAARIADIHQDPLLSNLFLIILINTPGFVVAVINSYCWNKYWVFQKGRAEKPSADFGKFLLVTVLGAVINNGIVSGVTILSQTGRAPEILLNIAKAGATVVTLVWNFLGFKLFVFGRGKNAQS